MPKPKALRPDHLRELPPSLQPHDDLPLSLMLIFLAGQQGPAHLIAGVFPVPSLLSEWCPCPQSWESLSSAAGIGQHSGLFCPWTPTEGGRCFGCASSLWDSRTHSNKSQGCPEQPRLLRALTCGDVQTLRPIHLLSDFITRPRIQPRFVLRSYRRLREPGTDLWLPIKIMWFHHETWKLWLHFSFGDFGFAPGARV